MKTENAHICWNYSKRSVKGANWLLRHAFETVALTLHKRGEGGHLSARLMSGKTFECDFPNWETLVWWVQHHRCLSHCQVETLVPGIHQPARLLGALETVCAGHFVLWSTTPQEAWATIDRKSPFVGHTVTHLRREFQKPSMQFATRRQIE